MEDLTLEIEKNVYEGVGLARYSGIAVFIKGAIKGEIARVRIVKKNKNFYKGELIEIIKPSLHRIKPKCPYNKPCGACDFSFIEYDYQAELKNEILKEIFEGVQLLPFIKTEKNLGYRNKTQYPVSETKNSKRLLIGYYKEKTHEITNIKFCPVQPPVIDEIAEFVRENWKFSGYIEKKDKGLLKHINTRINRQGEILLTFVLNSREMPDINGFFDNIIQKFPQIKGVFVNFNPDKTNKITGEKTVLVKGQNFIVENLEDKKFQIGSNSFFQVNIDGALKLFNCAKKLITKKGTFLDLYGGCGTIGIFLKDVVSKITLVEENEESIKLAKENFKLNNILKYEVFEGRAKEVIEGFIKEKRQFETILIDPPRKGSDIETLDNISKMTKSLIYISCNPMTLKRDSITLINKGFKFKSLQGVDMFPNTHHIECVAHFVKEEN